MNVILTHEQADFDALAAELGAYLMNENALPVLPRRMNRNVRAFLTLYGAELPFLEARDLPLEPIETVTLVDTQSLVTLKGMSTKTKVQVVDHHALRAELPEDWKIDVDLVGACTTLFVEGLREHNGGLNSLYATLLLLGIYEDTGSLSYSGTTPRDVRAAAFLLEQGASLKILSRFLNLPLTDDQRQVYDHLLATADRYVIHGQNILVARADAEELMDEISTIAHKLRDLLDPDALFLIVRTPEGIRLVARSVSDSLNVSKVAEHFGGGGHNRAAAALIRLTEETGPDLQPVKRPTIDQVYAELMDILPSYVRPPLIVRQIMSPHPLVLAPDTSAEKAAQLMQRYGYEGFPVVDHEKVCGLLTRRTVDRALSHRLNLPASSLMESGEITVQPDDSLDHLRRLMVDTGWGQIPVVDAGSGQIIGIVTRTDLLKTTDFAPSPEQQNLAGRLEAALSPTRLALLIAIAAKAREQNMAVYIVGGFVRDLLIGRPSPDFDIVIEGDAITLAKTLATEYGGRLISHRRFGTSKWTISEIRNDLIQAISPDRTLDPANLPDSLDMISARTEFYDYPTALPTIERSSIKHDLHRRDFTINTMAIRLDGRHYGNLYDYWGGQRDLRRGLVRVLHSLSFVDDPTRMMRAVRFEQRFGFQIEERTLQLIQEARPLIRQISGDRLRHEFALIFNEENALPMLQRLQSLNLLSAIHPSLDWSAEYSLFMLKVLFEKRPDQWELPERIASLTLRQSLAFLVWIVQYPQQDGTNICGRLRLPGELHETIKDAKLILQEADSLIKQPPSSITRRLDVVSTLVLYLVELLCPSTELGRVISRYYTAWRNTWPATDGKTLLQMGVTPGPEYKTILAALRSAWLDGKIRSEEEETHLLQDLLGSVQRAEAGRRKNEEQ